MSRFQASRRWRKKRGGAGPEGAPRPETAEVHELVQALDKIERSASLYPPGSTVLKGFVDDLHARLQSLLAKVHVLELTVGADEIEYEGEVVFDGTKLDRSLAFALEDGGVRRLIFREGMDRSEVVGLVEALQAARAPNAEDLATLLWQRELRHVSYIAVTFFSDPGVDAALDAVDLEASNRTLIDRLRGRELSIDSVAAVRASRKAAVQEEEEEPLDLFSIGPEDAAQIRRWIAECDEDSSAATIARGIIDLLAQDTGDEARRTRLAALQKILAKLIDAGDIASAAETVASVRRFADAGSTGAHVAASTRMHGPGNPFRAFVQAAAAKEIGQKLGKRLARARGDEVAAIEEYVLVCGKNAFGMAGDLLGSSHDGKMIAAMAEGCRGDYAFLREHVVDANPRVVSAAVRILAQVAGEKARKEFEEAARHKDPTVRRDAILALARCSDSHVFDKLLAALEDPAPEVRAAALRAAASAVAKARPEQFEVVLRIVDDAKRFDARPEPEQESFLVILGRLDAERGPAYLEKAIERFSLLHRDRTRRRRLQAIAALGELATGRAEEILRRTADAAKTDEIRMATRTALDRLEVVRGSAKPAPGAEKELPRKRERVGSAPSPEGEELPRKRERVGSAPSPEGEELTRKRERVDRVPSPEGEDFARG